MSRVINSESAGKDRTRLTKIVVIAIRELLRQKEDWPALNKLTHRVLDEGFLPSDNRSNSPFEWWPFIEGVMRTGEEDLAYELSNSAIREDTAYTGFFENRLSKLKNQTDNQ